MLAAAGIAEPAEGGAMISIEQDEAERDEFFSTLLERHPGPDPGSTFLEDSKAKVDAGSSPA